MTFEEWAKSEGFDIDKWKYPKEDYIYCDSDVNNMFKAWNASRENMQDKEK